MLPVEITESLVWGPLFAAGVFAALVVVSLIANLVFRLALRRRRRDNPDSLSTHVVQILRAPVVLALAIFGLFLALEVLARLTHPALVVLEILDVWANKAFVVSVIVLVSFAASRISQASMSWFIGRVLTDSRSTLDSKLGPTVGRILPIVIYTIGTLIALDFLGIQISPLLAGLGIGGLAVALAITPTVSSFIAGTYVVTEGQIREGDYIEIQDEIAGWVEDVGWRSTIVRSRFNNIVIIPNSKLTDSIVTNFSTPTPVLTNIVECGVSYDSNLADVKRISLEVTNEVVDESEFAVKDFEPLLRFGEFGDSNINFRIIFQATDRIAGIAMKSDVIERLHDRFKQEGIEINYPVRKLILPPGVEGMTDMVSQTDSISGPSESGSPNG